MVQYSYAVCGKQTHGHALVGCAQKSNGYSFRFLNSLLYITLLRNDVNNWQQIKMWTKNNNATPSKRSPDAYFAFSYNANKCNVVQSKYEATECYPEKSDPFPFYKYIWKDTYYFTTNSLYCTAIIIRKIEIDAKTRSRRGR